ncbi:MAG: hypothetical protein SNJ77_07030 [Cytophagales bacterium]
MPLKKKIFFLIAVLFTTLMIFLSYDMGKKTIKPWEKKKNNILEKYKVKY